jgi:CheY-specific phosphatase CheX
MMDKIRAVAISTIQDILETMFFIFAEPMENGLESGPGESNATPPQVEDDQYVSGQIHFQGVPSGTLQVLLPFSLAHTMARNFMGLEDEASESQTQDMVGELVNMICGNLLAALNPKESHGLSLPETRLVFQPGKEIIESGEGTTILLDADGHWIRMQIGLISPSPGGRSAP